MTRLCGLAAALRGKGFRLTPQRLVILSAVEGSEDHISAEEIYLSVAARFPAVNISTVYRTLELLKRLGLVIETDLGEGRVRYHPADKGQHHHLVCRECGGITDLDDSLVGSLEKSLMEQYRFAADLRHLAILGRCAGCNK